MKDLTESMKHLQKVAEMLSSLNLDEAQPWNALRLVQGALDGNFWEHLIQLSRSAQGQQRKAKEEGVLEPLFVPHMDVFLTPRKVVVCCEVCGLDTSSLEVSLTDRRNLLVKGRIRDHELAPHRVRKERYCGKFVRQIKLPVPVKSEGFRTSYLDGLLELHFARQIAGKETRFQPFSSGQES